MFTIPFFSQEISYILLGILGLFFLDFLMGVCIALKRRTFSLEKLPDFIKTGLAPFVVPLIAIAFIANVNEAIKISYITISSAVSLMLINGIKDKIIILFTAIPTIAPEPKQTE